MALKLTERRRQHGQKINESLILTAPGRDKDRLALAILTRVPLHHHDDEVDADNCCIELPESSIDEKAVQNASQNE